VTGRADRSTPRAARGHYALDLAITAEDVPAPLRPALLVGYQEMRPLPPGYAEHQDALLAERILFHAS
jgi:Ser/Thr protein kinase RdoA (MazF antagonist)